MSIAHVLCLAGAAAFGMVMAFSRAPRRTYLDFIFLAFPFMDLAITPDSWGLFRLFDGITTVAFILTITGTFRLGRRLRFTTHHALLLVLGISLAVGAVNSEFPGNALRSILAIASVFLFAFLLHEECQNDPGYVQRLQKLIGIGLCLSFAMVGLQLVFGLSVTFYNSINSNTTQYSWVRFPGFFQDPQLFGQYLTLAGFVILGSASPSGRVDVKQVVLFLVSVVALILTGGRSALLGYLVGSTLILFVSRVKWKIEFSIVVGTALLFFLAADNTISGFNRMEALGDDLDYRSEIWEDAIQVYADHPAIGVGFGNYKPFNERHSDNFFIDEANEVIFVGYGQPENGFLNILAETGFIGFSVFLLLVLWPFMSGWRPVNVRAVLSVSQSARIGIIAWLISFSSAYSLYDKRICILLVATLLMASLRNWPASRGHK